MKHLLLEGGDVSFTASDTSTGHDPFKPIDNPQPTGLTNIRVSMFPARRVYQYPLVLDAFPRRAGRLHALAGDLTIGFASGFVSNDQLTPFRVGQGGGADVSVWDRRLAFRRPCADGDCGARTCSSEARVCIEPVADVVCE